MGLCVIPGVWMPITVRENGSHSTLKWAEVLCMNGMTYNKTIPAASPQLSFKRLSLAAGEERRGGRAGVSFWAEQQSHSSWKGIVIWISMDHQNTFFPRRWGWVCGGNSMFYALGLVFVSRRHFI